MITLQEIHERDKRPPSVTVSMICYNHEKYLDKAIRGVLMQKTNFPVNIVIHDDASTDRSQEIIRHYASENPNITAILQEKNLYQNGKKILPFLLPYYTGKYIAFCECDDFWIDEHKLQIQVDYLEKNPDCIAVYSNVTFVNEYSQCDESLRTFDKTSEGDYPAEYFFSTPHQIASMMMRNFYRYMKTEEINFYTHVRANGDQKLLAVCLNLGRVHYFREEFSAYRRVLGGQSWTNRFMEKSKYEKHQFYVKSFSEIYLMIEYLFGKKYWDKYIYVLWYEMKGYLKYHKSVVKDAPLNECYQYRNIPWFIWPIFAVFAPYMTFIWLLKKIAKMIIPKKILTLVRNSSMSDSSIISRVSRLASRII